MSNETATPPPYYDLGLGVPLWVVIVWAAAGVIVIVMVALVVYQCFYRKKGRAPNSEIDIEECRNSPGMFEINPQQMLSPSFTRHMRIPRAMEVRIVETEPSQLGTPLSPRLQPRHIVYDTRQPRPIVNDTPQQRHIAYETQQPRHIVFDTQQPRHIVNDTRQPLHIVNDTQQQRHIAYDTPQPRHIGYDTPETPPSNRLILDVRQIEYDCELPTSRVTLSREASLRLSNISEESRAKQLYREKMLVNELRQKLRNGRRISEEDYSD